MIHKKIKIITSILIFIVATDTVHASPDIKTEMDKIVDKWSNDLSNDAKNLLTESIREYLSNKLGDDDPNIREGTSKELKEYTWTLSLPDNQREVDILIYALTSLLGNSDPEVADRAKRDLKHLNELIPYLDDHLILESPLKPLDDNCRQICHSVGGGEGLGVRGPSFDILGFIILSACLIAISIFRFKKK